MPVELDIPYIPYIYEVGPIDVQMGDLENDPLSFLQRGGNCQLFANAMTNLRGFYLPQEYRSSEACEDPGNYLKRVSLDETRTGDIIGLATDGERDNKRIHLGIVSRNGDLSVVHNSRSFGRVAVTPLDWFAEQGQVVVFTATPTAENPVTKRPEITKIFGL